MDNKFTQKIQDWLNAMPDKQNVADGAMLLLQLNRNRILYNNIIRNPVKMKPKLEYELQKHLRYRLDGLNQAQVAAMDKKVTAVVKATIEQQPLKGQRADHAKLPAEIQNLFVEAHDHMVTMRSIHERLKIMNSQPPCERYPFLKELLAEHDKYRECYNRYDNYDVNNPEPVYSEEEKKDAEAETAKAYATYRGYVLSNIKKLKAAKGDKATRLRDKMQCRFDECRKVNIVFSQETLDQLKELGIE